MALNRPSLSHVRPELNVGEPGPKARVACLEGSEVGKRFMDSDCVFRILEIAVCRLQKFERRLGRQGSLHIPLASEANLGNPNLLLAVFFQICADGTSKAVREGSSEYSECCHPTSSRDRK